MSSPFAQASTLMDTVASHASLLTTTRIHPGAGDTAETADARAQGVAQRAILTEDWLTDTSALAQQQAAVDEALMAAPKPADLEAWHAQISGSTVMDSATKQAEIHAFLQAAKQRREALDTHTAETITDVPALPEGVCEVPVVSFGGEGSPTVGKEKQGADGAETPQGETGESPTGSAEETPVSMTDPGGTAPVTMSTGTRETPVTMSDSAANTELSSSTMTDPAARAALSQPMGQGTPQVSGGSGQPAAMGAPGVSQQLTPPSSTQRGGTGTAPRSPEKRREAQDKRDERDATVQAASSVTLAGTAGAVAASMAAAPSSPGTATSGAPSAPAPSTPSAAPANPAPGGAPVGGAGMGGVGRGGSLGSGSTVKPVISAEQPPTPTLTPEEQRLLDDYDKKGDRK